MAKKLAGLIAPTLYLKRFLGATTLHLYDLSHLDGAQDDFARVKNIREEVEKRYSPEDQAAINRQVVGYLDRVQTPEFADKVTAIAKELHTEGLASGDRINELLREPDQLSRKPQAPITGGNKPKNIPGQPDPRQLELEKAALLSRRPPSPEEAPAPEGATHIFNPETKKIEPVEPEVIPAADGGNEAQPVHPDVVAPENGAERLEHDRTVKPHYLNEAYKAYQKDPLTEDSFAKALRKYITKMVKDQAAKDGYFSKAHFDTIEDAIGESLLEVWKQLPTYNPLKAKLTTFVYPIVKQNIKDIYRKYSNKQEEGYTERVDLEHQGEESDGLGEESGGPTIAPPTLGPEFIADNLVSKLGVVSQAIFKMKTYGYSDAEIAKRLGHDDTRWASNKWAYIQTKLRELATPLYKYNPVTRKMEKNTHRS